RFWHRAARAFERGAGKRVPAPDVARPWPSQGEPRLRLLFPAIPLPIPALDAPTRAPWPVWSGSTSLPVRFAPTPEKAAVRLWHRARDFDRGTHQLGRHGGALGLTALAVLHALIFDFLNHRTGR